MYWYEAAFYGVMGIAFAAVLLFLFLNHYINFKRKEDIPASKFFAYLDCEFNRGTHHFIPQGVDFYQVSLGGHRYKVCSRCTKVRREANE